MAYRAFLAERDGVLDMEKRTLSRREHGMSRFERPLSRIREIDRDRFRAQCIRFDPKRTMPREELLLLALIRLNAAEAYGIDNTIDYARERARRAPDELEFWLHVEESYHTRILLSSAVLYGIQLDAPFKPAASLRALISGVSRAPELLARPLILASEIVGTRILLDVLRVVPSILGHDPELRDAIEERVLDVLVDEIGHVSFNRMLLGPFGLKQAKLLLPAVAEVAVRTLPALQAMGLWPIASGADLANLPSQVRAAAFLA